ncbi:MAG: hypothetical protein LBE12_04425 [Planctomycetaceae bacterium]|nr:hypothetical protein [Planctomycetaceae bacterium]
MRHYPLSTLNYPLNQGFLFWERVLKLGVVLTIFGDNRFIIKEFTFYVCF